MPWPVFPEVLVAMSVCLEAWAVTDLDHPAHHISWFGCLVLTAWNKIMIMCTTQLCL